MSIIHRACVIFFFLQLSSAALAMDSSNIVPVNAIAKKYKAYIDTEHCVDTIKKVFVVIGGGGGGDLSQHCPTDHPVMYSWNHKVVYTTAVPWFGSVMAGGGDTSAKCCAIAYQWG